MPVLLSAHTKIVTVVEEALASVNHNVAEVDEGAIIKWV